MNSTGYRPSHRNGRWDTLYFEGDENRYEHWEVKMLAYMKLKKLKKYILPTDGDTTAANPDKNEEAFAELIQFLDDTSLSPVIRDARDDGKKALEILHEHYAGSGKPIIISLYTQLTSLQKKYMETITEYIICAESAATALRSAGEVVLDGLLIAMVLKGLPKEYKAFFVVVTQNEKTQTFQKFKVRGK